MIFQRKPNVFSLKNNKLSWKDTWGLAVCFVINRLIESHSFKATGRQKKHSEHRIFSETTKTLFFH